jgi:hypothetical protein
MSKAVTLQLRCLSEAPPDETAARLEALATKSEHSVDETIAWMVEESLRLNELPEIEFRTFNGERHACVKGAMQIWQLVMVAWGWDLDAEKTAKYFPIPVHRIQGAFDYYRAYPEEIDRAFAENDSWTFERLKQVHPQINRISVDLGPDDDDIVID